MRTYKDAKAMARSLRHSLAARNVSLTHSECLEIVAKQFGWKDWNGLASALDVQAGRLVSPQTPGIEFQPPIPVLKVASLEAARPFYEGFLGFQFDWGFPEGNTYAQISRSGITLHLNAESRLKGSAGMLIRMRGLDALHRELNEKAGSFAPSEISFTDWDSRVFHVIDPFGNGIRFWENNPPGVARKVEDREEG
jgi:hypothetical protein